MEFFEDGRLELYNLKDDISQKHNLVQSNPDKAKELHQKLTEWRKQTQAKMPMANANPEKTPNQKGKGNPKGNKKRKAAEEDA